jgi:prepilin-type N-terminal cleavage/methylation domain-containing protein
MNRKGMTLIELLVVLVMSGILVAGVYRTFISQQHTFTVQEQVVDMQQNVRLAINRMTRELRMAGYGRMDATFFGIGKVHGAYSSVVTPNGAGSVTVIGGYQAVTTLSAFASAGQDFILLNDASGFNLVERQYICINGLDSHQIKSITGNKIEFKGNAGEKKLTDDHQAGEPVFLITAITYSHGIIGDPSRGVAGDPLLRDDNLGFGPQPVAENIDTLQFRYVMNTGETLDVVPAPRFDDIRMIQVNIVARTERTDPQLAKVSDGFRRRNITSNIQLRNRSFL